MSISFCWELTGVTPPRLTVGPGRGAAAAVVAALDILTNESSALMAAGPALPTWTNVAVLGPYRGLLGVSWGLFDGFLMLI